MITGKSFNRTFVLNDDKLFSESSTNTLRVSSETAPRLRTRLPIHCGASSRISMPSILIRLWISVVDIAPGTAWLTACPTGRPPYWISQHTGSWTRVPCVGGSPWKNGGRIRATMSQDIVPAHNVTTIPTKIRLPMRSLPFYLSA